LVRFYLGHQLVKTHPRKQPGERSTDASDFPPEKAATARRDVAFFVTQAAAHGDDVRRFAERILAGPLPWTRMRQVYKLLALVKRFGAQRVSAACSQALAADMTDVRRLERMVMLGMPCLTVPPNNVIQLARYLRPASQYALAFREPRNAENESEETS
jgi:hypothetical protein